MVAVIFIPDVPNSPSFVETSSDFKCMWGLAHFFFKGLESFIGHKVSALTIQFSH